MPTEPSAGPKVAETETNSRPDSKLSPWALLRQLFQLSDDSDEAGTIADIKRNIEFRGANLWALIFAILIASVGLNTNSAAVIIGAMLISPLMGPIMGLGLALGTNDFDLFKRSLRNLLVAVSISVFTSALYFLITPLGQAQSELLARTRPTIFDVLIAICGGSIGIIASSRREKSNAIPGVAIATALMPPLCTAGYGLAKGNWHFFLGAFYLFFINSVFICLSTVVVVRLLHFHKASFVSPARERRVRQWLALFAIITILPSTFAAWEVVQESLFQNRAQRFLTEVFTFTDTQIIKSEFKFQPQGSHIRLLLIGKPLRPEQQQKMISRLPEFQLQGTELQIQQPNQGNGQLQAEFDALNQSLRTGIVEDLYKKNAELLDQKDAELQKQQTRIAVLEKQLESQKQQTYPLAQLLKELQLSFPQLRTLAIDDVTRIQDGKLLTGPVALVQWKVQPSVSERDRLQKFLKIRLNKPQMQVVNY